MLPPSLMPTPTSVKKSSEGASNGNGSSHYDATTVEQIKAQFQAQIEAMMLSQVRNWLLAFWVVHVQNRTACLAYLIAFSNFSCMFLNPNICY